MARCELQKICMTSSTEEICKTDVSLVTSSICRTSLTPPAFGIQYSEAFSGSWGRGQSEICRKQSVIVNSFFRVETIEQLLRQTGYLMTSTNSITVLVHEYANGDKSALDRLLPLVYAELRRLVVGIGPQQTRYIIENEAEFAIDRILGHAPPTVGK